VSESPKQLNRTVSLGGASIIALAVLLAGIIAPWLLRSVPPSASVVTNPTAPSATNAVWGELILQSVEVEKPDAYVTAQYDTNVPTTWTFGNVTVPQLAQFLAQAGLPPREIARLTNQSTTTLTSRGMVVQPGTDLVLNLPSDTRRVLYSALAQLGENHLQAFPFTFRADGFDAWFADSGVSSNAIALVKQLSYRRGQTLCFSDLPEVLSTMPDPDQRRRLLKTLSRQSTVLMKLRIRPDTDVDKLLAYWGRGAQMKDARPLIESLTKIPETATLDVVHLLPPFARRRLYTYPFPPTRPEDGGEDCHWTAMNFFSDTPDNRFRNKQTCAETIVKDYYNVTGPSRYGDVVIFMDASDNVIHSAIYIAADILFTKNGASHYQPWTLMHLKDVLATYPTDQPLRVMTFRDKRY
jgi:hypothetical protein